MNSNPILSFDTSDAVLGVHLRSEEGVIGTKVIEKPRVHASHLIPTIQELMASAGLSMRDLSAVAVAKGPGSYTGLRIGVSTAKGLAFALQIPVIGVLTMHAMAVSQLRTGCRDPLITCLSSRRNEIYMQLWNLEPHPVPVTVLATYTLDEAISRLSRDPKSNHFQSAGSGTAALIQAADRNSTLKISLAQAATATVEGIGILAQQAFESGKFDDVSALEPFYLNDFVAKKGVSPIEAARNR